MSGQAFTCDICHAPGRIVGHGGLVKGGVMREYEQIACTRCRRQWQYLSASAGPDCADFEYDGDESL